VRPAPQRGGARPQRHPGTGLRRRAARRARARRPRRGGARPRRARAPRGRPRAAPPPPAARACARPPRAAARPARAGRRSRPQCCPKAERQSLLRCLGRRKDPGQGAQPVTAPGAKPMVMCLMWLGPPGWPLPKHAVPRRHQARLESTGKQVCRLGVAQAAQRAAAPPAHLLAQQRRGALRGLGLLAPPLRGRLLPQRPGLRGGCRALLTLLTLAQSAACPGACAARAAAGHPQNAAGP